MADQHTSIALGQLRKLLAAERDTRRSDAQLLGRFIAERDEAAFAVLVRRHGDMVQGVCQSVLGSVQDAEDVSQATFLILARKAGAIHKQNSIASWLHGVAFRLARKLKASRKPKPESQPIEQTPANPMDEVSWREVRQIVHEELQRLPQKYRQPLILCYLEGQTQEEAARQLGWSAGQLKGMVSRGRDVLRQRLTRRGLALTAPLFAGALAPGTSSAMMAKSTAHAAVLLLSGQAVGGGISVHAVALAKGGMSSLVMTKVKLVAVVLIAAGVVAAGGGLAGKQKQAKAPSRQTPPAKAAQAGIEKKDVPAKTDLNGDPLPAGAVARLGTVRFRHEAEATGLRFSPDGQTLVATTSSNVIIWDAKTGKERHRLPFRAGGVPRELGNSQNIDISPDGTSLAVIDFSVAFGSFWKLLLFDLRSGTKTRSLELPETKNPLDAMVFGRALRFSPDGKSLAVAFDLKLLVGDLATGKWRTVRGSDRAAVYGLAFSPDGKTLAVGTSGPPLQLWDIATGTMVRGVEEPGQTLVHAVAFSPDGKMVAAAWRDLILFVDPHTGKELRRLEATMQSVNGVAFTPDGKTLVSGSEDGALRAWDVASGKIRSTMESQMTGRSMALAPDGKTAALGTASSVVKLWDVATGKEKLFGEGHNSEVWQLAFSPDGKSLFSSEHYSQIRVWDVATWKTKKVLPERAVSLSVSPDGKRLAWASNNSNVRIYDLANDRADLTIAVPDTKDVRTAIFSPDGRKLFTWDKIPGDPAAKNVTWGPNRLRHWDAVTGKQEQMWVFPQQMHKPLIAPDGMAVLVNQNDTIQLHDVKTGRTRLLKSTANGGMIPLAVSRDSRFLVSGDTSQYFAVRLWELATGKEIFALQGHGPLAVAAWSADGRFIATADHIKHPGNPYEGAATVRLWDAVTGKELACFGGLRPLVLSLAISPDNAFLATGLEDSTILIWDIRQQTLSARLAAKQLDAGDLEKNWANLGGADVPKAYDAAWTFVAAPQQSVAFLGGRLKPVVPTMNAPKVAKWITDLDSDKFAVRETAAKELHNVGEQVRPILSRSLKGNVTLEARRRLEQVLINLADEPKLETLRNLRAIMVLEKIASSDAQQILEALAQGAPGARETEEAQAALRRLGK